MGLSLKGILRGTGKVITSGLKVAAKSAIQAVAGPVISVASNIIREVSHVQDIAKQVQALPQVPPLMGAMPTAPPRDANPGTPFGLGGARTWTLTETDVRQLVQRIQQRVYETGG